jgi:hypothetical protein
VALLRSSSDTITREGAPLRLPLRVGSCVLCRGGNFDPPRSLALQQTTACLWGMEYFCSNGSLDK